MTIFIIEVMNTFYVLVNVILSVMFHNNILGTSFAKPACPHTLYPYRLAPAGATRSKIKSDSFSVCISFRRAARLMSYEQHIFVPGRARCGLPPLAIAQVYC